MFLEQRRSQVLCHQVGALSISFYLFDSDVAQLVVIANEVTIEFYVLVAPRYDWVFDHLDARVIVLEHQCRLVFDSLQLEQHIA